MARRSKFGGHMSSMHAAGIGSFCLFVQPVNRRRAIAPMPISATGCAFSQLALLALSLHPHDSEGFEIFNVCFGAISQNIDRRCAATNHPLQKLLHQAIFKRTTTRSRARHVRFGPFHSTEGVPMSDTAPHTPPEMRVPFHRSAQTTSIRSTRILNGRFDRLPAHRMPVDRVALCSGQNSRRGV